MGSWGSLTATEVGRVGFAVWDRLGATVGRCVTGPLGWGAWGEGVGVPRGITGGGQFKGARGSRVPLWVFRGQLGEHGSLGSLGDTEGVSQVK